MQDQRIDVHGLSIRGEQHDANQDHFAIADLSKSMRLHQTNLSIDDDTRVHGRNQGLVFLVADGVSSGHAPRAASGRAVDSVVRYFLDEMPWCHLSEGQPDDVRQALEEAIENAQSEFEWRNRKRGMGTTLTLAFVSWPDLYVAHVGDSRCLLHRRGTTTQLTTDHTLAEARDGLGVDARPRGGSVLWNAVGGPNRDLHVETRHTTLEPGDLLCLVTDGVLSASGGARLALEADRTAEENCHALTAHEGPDDRTAVVVRFEPKVGEAVSAVHAPDPALVADAEPECAGRDGRPASPRPESRPAVV